MTKVSEAAGVASASARVRADVRAGVSAAESVESAEIAESAVSLGEGGAAALDIPDTSDARRLPVVAFICTHNACRSQLAEALARDLAAGVLKPVSAGTHPVAAVDAGALRLLESRGIATEGLRPKALSDIPAADYVVTMGCGVSCPTLPCKSREDWGLEDPTGKGDAAYEQCAADILAHLGQLRRKILAAK